MRSAAHQSEVEALARRYGAPRRLAVTLPGGPFNPISATDRVGEVCMVVRRPSGRLLTAIKTFYPPGAFRLLTGGVGPDEPIEAALLRELAEETSLDVAVRRFLTVIDYRLEAAPADAPDAFTTFAFLVDELGGELAVQDEHEQLAAFGEIDPADLPQLAATLEQSPDRYHPEIQGSWRDWGRFRAVVHRAVYEALQA